jgi:predicted enzyme related to lactoylglutathione lyase
MQRVRGVGGVFFKTRGDRPTLLQWYQDHLGIDIEAGWGGTVFSPNEVGLTWSIFKSDTEYFSPGSAPFMINYIVDDLEAMLSQLREAGVDVSENIEDNDYGKFGWAIDPEDNRIELWQQPHKLA